MSKSLGATTSLKNGLRVVTAASWQDFREQAIALKTKRGFVWRGQTKDWPLQSSFDRKVSTKNSQDRLKKLASHLDAFRQRMHKSYPNLLPRDDVDAWALAQHYGLKTPFLDWTSSPYIAAYFALIERNDPNDPDDDYRYIYALDRTIERLVSKLKHGSRVLSRDQSVPFIDKLAIPNPRFSAQKGVFTNGLRGKAIEEFMDSFTRKRPDNLIMVKFRIPTIYRDECLRDLHLMNIDHTSLLLDLRDVVEDCNTQ
jgi:hypothetical protein